jgi:hypothetical protein
MNATGRNELEERLVALLRSEERASAPPDALRTALERVAVTGQVARRIRTPSSLTGRRRDQGWKIGLLGLAAVLATVAGIIGSGAARPVDQSSLSETARPAGSRALEIAATLDLGFRPHVVATGFGAVWVAGVVDEYAAAAKLVRIDPVSHQMTDVAVELSACYPAFYDWPTIVTGFGSLWVPDCGGKRILRLDPDTGRVQAAFVGFAGRSPISADHLVAFDVSAAYAVRDTRDGAIDRVDVTTNKATPFVTLHEPVVDIGVDGQSMWVRTDTAIARVDLSDGVVLSSTPLDAPSSTEISGTMLVVDHRPWVVDPTHDHPAIVVVEGTRPRRVDIGGIAHRFAFTHGRVWTIRDKFTLVSIDPDRRVVLDTLIVDDGDGGLAADEHSIWVGVLNGNKLLQIPAP